MTKKTKMELMAELENMEKRLEALERYEKYQEGADEVAAVRDAYVSAGFSEEQAFELIKLIMAGCVKNARF